MRYELEGDSVFGGPAGNLISDHLLSPNRPKERRVAGQCVVGVGIHHDSVAAEYERLRGSDFLVSRAETFVAYGGDLPYDVLMVIGFDGVQSPLLDVRFMVRPDHQYAVTSTRIRLVPLDELAREAVHQCRSVFRETQPGELRVVSEDERRSTYATAMDQGRFESRRRISDEDMRHTAEVYRLACGNGLHPTAAVQRELRLPNRNVAKKWVKRARSQGFLPPAPGPRRGGVDETTD